MKCKTLVLARIQWTDRFKLQLCSISHQNLTTIISTQNQRTFHNSKLEINQIITRLTSESMSFVLLPLIETEREIGLYLHRNRQNKIERWNAECNCITNSRQLECQGVQDRSTRLLHVLYAIEYHRYLSDCNNIPNRVSRKSTSSQNRVLGLVL